VFNDLSRHHVRLNRDLDSDHLSVETGRGLDVDRRNLDIADDYDSEYRYSGRPIPALQGLDQSDSVIFAGSFSKVLFPSLRLGYLVVPIGLIDKFAAARYTMDRHSAVIDQAILCDFITEGHFGLHIRRMREGVTCRAIRFTIYRGPNECSIALSDYKTIFWTAFTYWSNHYSEHAIWRSIAL
jgi:hypothetical protein